MFQKASKIQPANIKTEKDIYQRTTFSEENTKIISDLKLPLCQIKHVISQEVINKQV